LEKFKKKLSLSIKLIVDDVHIIFNEGLDKLQSQIIYIYMSSLVNKGII